MLYAKPVLVLLLMINKFMKDEDEIKFHDLVFKALDHAIDSVTDGGVLVPFVMTQNNLSRFVSGKIEEAKAEAEIYIEEEKNEPLLVLAYDGFVTIENIKNDAIFVKGVDRNKKKKLVIAQRYVPATSKQVFKTVGNPVLIEQGNL